MELFYSQELTEYTQTIQLSKDESHHLKRVLRKQREESLEITNGNGIYALAIITDEQLPRISCTIRSLKRIPPPPERNIQLALSTIRPKRMDWAIEKLTELGIGTIQPLISEFTTIRHFKSAHLHKIAISAMKQSKQSYLPQINSPLIFSQWLEKLAAADLNQSRLFAHLSHHPKLVDQIPIKKETPIIIAIGPEGGFSENEARLAERCNFQPISLGNHILRTETAAVTAVAQVKLKLRTRG